MGNCGRIKKRGGRGASSKNLKVSPVGLFRLVWFVVVLFCLLCFCFPGQTSLQLRQELSDGC